MSDPLVVIRRLLAADLADYKALRDQTLADHPQSFISDAETERLREAAQYLPRLGLDRQGGGHFTLGAWQSTRLVGAVSCDREPRVKVRHVARIAGLMVHREHSRRGIGDALLSAAIDAARRADGLEMLTLSVTAGNEAALRLYERAGFVRYASLPRAIKLDGRYFTKEQMVLAL